MTECIAIGSTDGFQPVTESTDKVNSPDGLFIYLKAPAVNRYDKANARAKGTISQVCEGRCPHFNKDCFPREGVESKSRLLFMLDHHPIILGLNQKKKFLYE